MRTVEEIVARINDREANDWLGFELGDYIDCLPFDAAKPWLKEGVTADEWTEMPRDRDSVLARMLEYMPFAWEKANNGRGLSASRSMSHYTAWAWLVGDDFGNLQDYEYYGKDNLVRICNHYGWNYAKWDDGERTNG